jgi:hypothetical protein
VQRGMQNKASVNQLLETQQKYIVLLDT